MNTVSITPTFVEAVAIYIALIEHSAAAERPSFALAKAADDAKRELLAMAGRLDEIADQSERETA